MFTYAELLLIWDGLSRLNPTTRVNYKGESVRVSELLEKVRAEGERLGASEATTNTVLATADNNEVASVLKMCIHCSRIVSVPDSDNQRHPGSAWVCDVCEAEEVK